MCNFFSFNSDGKGNISFFNAKERDTLNSSDDKRCWSQHYYQDSHSSIAQYVDPDLSPTADDYVNKYEYLRGEFVIDQINVEDDSEYVKEWIEKFVKTKEYYEIIKVAVLRDPRVLQFLTEEEQTEEVCLIACKSGNGYSNLLSNMINPTEKICIAAVGRNPQLLEHIKNPSEAVYIAAVQQRGELLGMVKNQTEKVCVAAILQNFYALLFVKEFTPKIAEAVNQSRKENSPWIPDCRHFHHLGSKSDVTPRMEYGMGGMCY